MKTTAFRTLVTMAVLLSSSVGSADAAERILNTNRTRFQIPFNIDALTSGRAEAKEVRLYVSSNNGATWKRSATTKPDTKRFRFEATEGDGEYWFDVRVVGADGKLYPGHKSYNPSLRVAVDTTGPEIEIRLGQMTGERVGVTWIVRDPNYKEKSLVLEYKQPGDSEWQTMGIVPRVTGGTAWSVKGLSGTVGVRATATDMAGNTGTTEKTLTLKEVVAEPEPEVVMPQPGSQPETTTNPFEAYSKETPATADKSARLAPVPDKKTVSSVPSIDSMGSPSTTDADYPVDVTENTGNKFSDFGPGLPENQSSAPAQGLSADSVTAEQLLNSGSMSEVAESVASSADGMGMNGIPGAAPATHRLVNNRRFQLDYALSDVGSSGVSKVEFFITEDGGRKWWKYGNDTDLKSPFNVVVPHDGVFGFAIRATSGAGYAGAAPRSGESPGLVVEVDSTKPNAIFKAFNPSSGRDLRVSWTAEDKNLAKSPIAISVAEGQTGPWTTITDWIANTGEVVWTPPKGLPHKMYFKLSAKDTAGNLAEFQTAKPVIIDFSRPTARLIDIEVKSGI